MTRDEREGLRRAIDRATRARLRAERERREPEKPWPRPRLSETEVLDAVEALLADGLCRTLASIAKEVGVAHRTAARVVRPLIALGRVETIPGVRPGSRTYRARADYWRSA